MTRNPDAVRAYVDGELDEITAARIAREAEIDGNLAAAIAAEQALRETLGMHFAPVLDEPVPERLTAPIDAARKVVSIEDAREQRFGFNRRTLRWAAPAMAAALVLALLIPGLGGGSQTEIRHGLTFASGDLARALDSQLVSEQLQGDETRVLLSFADDAGTICRGFAHSDISGIACREDGGWHVRVQRDGVDVAANDYRQAGSVDAAVMAAAQNMAKGAAMDAGEERAARDSGWQR